MKYLLLLIVILVACTSSKLMRSGDNVMHKSSLSSYKVYKIDSINTYYLIYAKKGDSLFKIVSKKESMINCSNKIRLNVSYSFKLHSSLTGLRIGNVLVSPAELPHVSCYTYDDSTKICVERDSINDLHHADNIKGLCFMDK
jgi:hypothetical protein